jgi:predicted Zn-dependent protease
MTTRKMIPQRHSMTFLLSLFFHLTSFAFNPYSTDEIDALEKAFVQAIHHSPLVETDPIINAYLNHLASQLAPSTMHPKPTIFLVKSNEINAFAGPGNYIGINSALIKSTQNESQLAAVIAHEIAHASKHHLYRSLEDEKNMSIPMLASALASLALGIVNPTLATGAMLASLTGFNQHSINRTRLLEKDADVVGQHYLTQAGFNPYGMVQFLNRLQSQSRLSTSSEIPTILRTHPLETERMSDVLNRIHPSHNTFRDSLDYKLIKTMVMNHASPLSELANLYQHCDHREITCAFGHALFYLQRHEPQKAILLINTLDLTYPKQPILLLTLTHAYTMANDTKHAAKTIASIPKDTGYTHAYVQIKAAISTVNQKYPKAFNALRNAFRQSPNNLALCQSLAKAAALKNDIAFAYFTESQCRLLDNRRHEALILLKTAKKFAKDRDLKDRIEARLDELS